MPQRVWPVLAATLLFAALWASCGAEEVPGLGGYGYEHPNDQRFIGRPKNDLAAQTAQMVFEKNAEAIEKAMLKALLKGNPKVFAVLADRGFGKLSQKLEVPEVVDLAEMLAQARERANRMGSANGAVGKTAE